MKVGIDRALSDPATRTPDIRGTGTQRQMIDGILKGMGEAHAHA
jgi:3-isopropylmalate dehydrogenase